MGLFNKMKYFISFRKDLKKFAKQFEKNTEKYSKLTTNELKELPEEELFDAVWTRIEKRINNYGDTYEDMIAGIHALSEKEKIFYCVNSLECEVNNGGLCQFFTNSSRAVAPFISECLGVIGAIEHKKLFDDFVKKYNINVNDLASFDCDDVDAFLEQYERFPFNKYDKAFYEMKPLEEYLKKFIKQNMDAF